jgi:hypothetical protein
VSSGAASEGVDAADRAARALALAGRSLDPNREGGLDVDLGRHLLREAVLSAAQALAKGAKPTSWNGALETLRGAGALEGAARTPARAEVLLHRLEGEARPADLEEVELAVTAIVDRARGTRTVARGKRLLRWARIAVVVAAACGAAGVLALIWPEKWSGYEYRASSAYAGYSTTGRLGEVTYGLVFHTALEEDPWVEIDLLDTRTIRRVALAGRLECCRERGIPMIVEAAGEDRAFAQLGRKERPFEAWLLDFDPRQARYVRIRSEGHTMLHLAEVRIE